MPTGTVATVARRYNYQMIHFLRKSLIFSDRANQVTVGWIPGGSIILPTLSGVLVSTLFNGSGADTLNLGSVGTPALILSAQTLAAAGWFPGAGATAANMVAADTQIVATYTDANSDSTTGALEALVAYVPALY